MPAAKDMTADDIRRTKQTGICAGTNSDGDVVIFRAVDGDTEWIEVIDPDYADQIGRELVRLAKVARKRVAS